jgi:type III secretory pathway component EscU
MYQENAHLLAKSVDKLLPSLEQALRDRVVDVRSAVARALGCIGAAVIARPIEGHIFVTWAMQNLDPTKKDPSKIPLLLAIKEVHSSRSCVHYREDSPYQDV